MATTHFRELKAFGSIVRTAASRELDLLRDIEGTLDSLDIELEHIRSANQDADYFIKLLRDSQAMPDRTGGDVDLVSIFEAARDSVGKAYKHFSVKHMCAVSSDELVEDDGVVEAYAALLTGLSELHDKLNTLSWILREDEADHDQALPGSFSNADDLFAAMGV